MDADVIELLEQEERKVRDREAAAKKGDTSKPGSRSESRASNGESRDPRRQGREGRKLVDNGDKYSAEREANNERRSRKSRDRDDDVHLKDANDRGSANRGVPNRRRSRSPAPFKDAYFSEQYPSLYREHREANAPPAPPSRGDRYRSGRTSAGPPDDDRYYRPYSRSRRDDDDRSFRGDRDRGDRRDDRRTDREIDRYSSGRDERDRRFSPRSRRPKSPEPTDDERDKRTVFVQQLAARLRTRELEMFFVQIGPVVEAQIVKDRISGRSKGVGYVEFKDEESVQKAIQLTGQKLLGIPIIVAITNAEKNRQVRNTEGVATQSNGIPFHRLYVGNIHFSITEDDLQNVFEPFGELEFVQLQKEEAGRSKGYGFVQFVDPTQAKEALEKMNGFEIAGRPIRVGLGNDKFTPESTQSLLQRFGSQAHQAAYQGSSFSGMGGRGAHAGGTGNFDRASGRDVDKTGGASALDDTDVAGVNLSNYSRDALMRKLARTDEAEAVVAPKTLQKKAAPIDEPAPSRCVLLKNMYNLAEENEPGWQKELEDDVRTECTDKYGHVVHIGLALDNTDGEIYIKFDRVQGGENAIRGLNGRYFGGRMITAQYVVDAVYNMNFPKAAGV